MEQKLKERLVGLAVLFVIAVICIPVIFTDPSATAPNAGLPFSTISEKTIERDNEATPNVQKSKDLESNSNPKNSVLKTQQVLVGKDKVVEEETEQRIAKNKVDEDTYTDLSAWSIQLGSFTNEDNAQSLNKKLRKEGYKAFVEPRESNGLTQYRVRVGPTIKRSEADLLLKELQKKMQLSGIVLSHSK